MDSNRGSTGHGHRLRASSPAQQQVTQSASCAATKRTAQTSRVRTSRSNCAIVTQACLCVPADDGQCWRTKQETVRSREPR